jgi:hypothetical protein
MHFVFYILYAATSILHAAPSTCLLKFCITHLALSFRMLLLHVCMPQLYHAYACCITRICLRVCETYILCAAFFFITASLCIVSCVALLQFPGSSTLGRFACGYSDFHYSCHSSKNHYYNRGRNVRCELETTQLQILTHVSDVQMFPGQYICLQITQYIWTRLG